MEKLTLAEKKILKELKSMNRTLKELKEIMDSIWRERTPQ